MIMSSHELDEEPHTDDPLDQKDGKRDEAVVVLPSARAVRVDE